MESIDVTLSGILMLVKLGQLQNAPLFIIVTEFGIFIFLIAHPKNVIFPMELTESGIVILTKLEQQ